MVFCGVLKSPDLFNTEVKWNKLQTSLLRDRMEQTAKQVCWEIEWNKLFYKWMCMCSLILRIWNPENSIVSESCATKLRQVAHVVPFREILFRVQSGLIIFIKMATRKGISISFDKIVMIDRQLKSKSPYEIRDL